MGDLPPVPPLARPFIWRLGMNERDDREALLAWFAQFGGVLGDPTEWPWCGEGMENAALEMFPLVPIPQKPYVAQNWQHYAVNAHDGSKGNEILMPVIGAVGVIRWSAKAGHVGVVADFNKTHVDMIGANQTDSINVSRFPRGKFIAFRLPAQEVGKRYAPFSRAPEAGGGMMATR
ncbi:hypothetical protein [uncultured Cohaesibacter sp.]|uniref:hypothetical protein n=1 Tax=uncultured Cohaesibacter sp. TaxID=1002546 RepID=UPI0029C7B185|nr:hypothetical protein [uncultured Cohaesibacter sp.]